MAVLSAVVLTSCGSDDAARAREENLRSNLEVIRALTHEIGKSVLDSAEGRFRDTVLLSTDSSAASWIARTELASLLHSAGRLVLTGTARGSAPARWDVRGVALTVEYRDIRKPGIFSRPVVNRVVSASISSEVTLGDTLIFAGTSTRTVTDTIPESRIAELETGSNGVTNGRVPDLRSIDRFIEPFVIIGATGAAILLFFQVRS